MVNHNDNLDIQYSEKGRDDCWEILPPKQSVYFTWRDPEGPRVLVWSVITSEGPEAGHEYKDDLKKDSQEYLELSTGQQMASVSFLDGLQRVLLFSQDPVLCYNLAHTTGENERISKEIDVSIYGIGLSLVNNAVANGANYELIYMSISSSDVVWEVRKQGKNR